MSELDQKLAAICQRFGVTSLYAFGSRARELAARCSGVAKAAIAGSPREERLGSANSPSDADIAVEPAPGGRLDNPRDRVALTAELEELFGVARVDLVVLHEAGAFLAADAIRGELIYCQDEDRQSREELFYLRRAGDLAPLQQERLRAVLAGELLQ